MWNEFICLYGRLEAVLVALAAHIRSPQVPLIITALLETVYMATFACGLIYCGGNHHIILCVALKCEAGHVTALSGWTQVIKVHNRMPLMVIRL